jgi:excisionase family DNA binding protein
MADAADQLAAAIRRVINDAVEAAVQSQRLPQPPLLPPESPKSVVDKQAEPRQERMLYSVKEVQHRLSIGRSTVYQLMRDGHLPSVKIGRRRFVTTAALNTYIESLCTPME